MDIFFKSICCCWKELVRCCFLTLGRMQRLYSIQKDVQPLQFNLFFKLKNQENRLKPPNQLCTPLVRDIFVLFPFSYTSLWLRLQQSPDRWYDYVILSCTTALFVGDAREPWIMVRWWDDRRPKMQRKNFCDLLVHRHFSLRDNSDLQMLMLQKKKKSF